MREKTLLLLKVVGCWYLPVMQQIIPIGRSMQEMHEWERTKVGFLGHFTA
jgi:hypothetical protein